MSNAWDDCRDLEKISRKHLREHLFPTMSFEGRYVQINKGEMASKFQATQGDYVINSDDDTAWRLEHKCEYSNFHGNFFIETFSNKSRGNPGWFWKLEADLLLYHFIESGEVYLMKLSTLRNWLYAPTHTGAPNVHSYKHKSQQRYEQLNDTWGYCVSISDVCAAINVRRLDVPPLSLAWRK